MIKNNLGSNCVHFELQLLCPRVEYLQAVVKILMNAECPIDFSIEREFPEPSQSAGDPYTIFIDGVWSHNLKELVDEINLIEDKELNMD